MAYEDIVADQAGAVKRVATLVGLAPSEYRIPPTEARETSFPPELEERRRALDRRMARYARHEPGGAMPALARPASRCTSTRAAAVRRCFSSRASPPMRCRG
jgi:hypothetical protein